MRFQLSLPLGAVALLCLACLAACGPAPGQLTVVQGTVVSATTGRPLPGVLLGIESYQVGFYNTTGRSYTDDSVQTDARGRYELHFYNQKGLSYAVVFEPRYLVNYTPRPSRYLLRGGSDPGRRELTIGKTNVADFQPDELRVVAVRIRNRNTGYRWLYFDNRILRGNNLDTLDYLRYYYPPQGPTSFTYRKFTPAGAPAQDTAVKMVVQNPAAPLPDTLRAALTFVR